MFLSIRIITKTKILFLKVICSVASSMKKNWASSGLEHAQKWKFELEHARALENSTWSSFCPGIWLKMHYFCQNLPIFKGSFAWSIKKSSIKHARASKIDFGRAFFGLEHAWVQHYNTVLKNLQIRSFLTCSEICCRTKKLRFKKCGFRTIY